jgi:hypothetical protein
MGKRSLVISLIIITGVFSTDEKSEIPYKSTTG